MTSWPLGIISYWLNSWKELDIMIKNIYCWAFSKKSNTWEWKTRVRKYLTHVQRLSVMQLFFKYRLSITGKIAFSLMECLQRAMRPQGVWGSRNGLSNKSIDEEKKQILRLCMYMHHILRVVFYTPLSASWVSGTYFPLLRYHLIFRLMNF